MPRLALHCRVSTVEQHAGTPVPALRQYAEGRDLDLADEYVDHRI